MCDNLKSLAIEAASPLSSLIKPIPYTLLSTTSTESKSNDNDTNSFNDTNNEGNTLCIKKRGNEEVDVDVDVDVDADPNTKGDEQKKQRKP